MTFPALERLDAFKHLFTLRHPDLDVAVDRAEALRRLALWHEEILRSDLEVEPAGVVMAEQVHGNRVAVIEAAPAAPVPGVDGMICGRAGVALGIYVADCCAVFLADPVTGAFGLLHSGRKGSELGITGVAIAALRENFGVQPENLVVQLSPCIRPPHYEVDFAAAIRRQARESGVQEGNIHDEGFDTASDLQRYYSYRMEEGKTGRMLAVLACRD